MVKKILIYLLIAIFVAVVGEFVNMMLGWIGLTSYMEVYNPFPIVVLVVCTGLIIDKIDQSKKM